MPLYTVRCPGCGHTLEDVLCTFTEAQTQRCTKCEIRVMEIVPTRCATIWACDTSFSESKKTVKE
jgi:predicted nucleic acid-binding Zn ribbon protein